MEIQSTVEGSTVEVVVMVLMMGMVTSEGQRGNTVVVAAVVTNEDQWGSTVVMAAVAAVMVVTVLVTVLVMVTRTG